MVDPIQSVKGKVVIDAFRLINPNMMVRSSNSTTERLANENLTLELIVDDSAGFGSRTKTDNQRVGSPPETQHTGAHPRPQQVCLLCQLIFHLNDL